ncbi:MAG: ABC transporter substrate-binding protein [bacterium]|nr:ABC transporter substrate-binding protein [bacterium]
MKLAYTLVFALLLAIPAMAQEPLTVIWGEDRADHGTLDPRVSQSRHEEQFIAQMFDQLIYADEFGNAYPGLASSWEVSDGGRCWTFSLRDGVTFHDGTRFDAAAVKFTFDSIQDPELGSQGAIDILGPYEGTEVVDDLTARVCFTRPYAAAQSAFGENELSIVSPTAVQTLGNDGFARSPVGTGPFVFVSWEEGRQIVLERNDAYAWAPEFFENQGPSQVERIVFRFIADASTRVAALEAGEVNVAELLPPLDMLSLQRSPGFETMVGNVSGLPFGIMLNTTRGPLEDIRVRKAFMHAIDRPQIAENLFFGFAPAEYGPLSSATPLYWSGVEAYYPFSLDQADALLDEAGWTERDGQGYRTKDGQRLSLYAPTLLEPETAVAVQAEVARVGIDLQVENVLKARQDELIFANGYDVLVIRWVSNDPGVLIIPFHTRNIPAPGKFKFNWARYSDPSLDALLEAGESANSPAERAAIYQEAQKTIMEAATYFALHQQVQTLGHSAELTGFRFAPGNWQVRFYDVRRAE